MKLVKTILALSSVVFLAACNPPQGSNTNPAYDKFINQSTTNEAKTHNFNKAVLTCSSIDTRGDHAIDKETYYLNNGVWTAFGFDDYKDYLTIKGSTLVDPIEDYKKMAADATAKDKEAESTYSSGYSSSDERCTADFEITIESAVAGFHQEKEYVFNEYGLLVSYNQEETNQTTLFITIAYSVEDPT